MVTGDVVNTAARIQGAAPVGGVAVGEQTYRATERVFEYEPLEPVVVKGKAEPLSLWRATAARARFGTDITRRYTTPLVGRELEKPLLIGTFERAAQQRSVQLVTVVGEPGVGKSRLVRRAVRLPGDEAGADALAAGALPALWGGDHVLGAGGDRQGGGGDPRVRLGRGGGGEAGRGGLPGGAGAAVVACSGCRRWSGSRRPRRRSGRSCSRPGGGSSKGWRRRGRRVLVFEDLHWADEALLAFLEHLAEWAEGVPLLILCTARPELYERHPGWAGGMRNATTINLPPLSDRETAELVSHLVTTSVLSAELEQARAGAGGRQPALCGGVRAPARRPRRLAGTRGEVPESRAGADRRPPGHAGAGAEEPAAGRGRAREGVLGRARWPRSAAATRASSSWRCTSWPARSSSAPPG